MVDWKGNTVVFTSVTGGYDRPQPQPYIDGVDYVFFTDDRDAFIPSPWRAVVLQDCGVSPKLDARRQAKYPKLFPQLFSILRGYRYGIWIDGTMELKRREFPAEILSYMKNGMVISPHFDGRDCAYGEATIDSHPKYQEEPLAAQAAYYRIEGFPEHYGLYECGVMARDLQNPQVKNLCERWLSQNLIWSYQDQVSLPYCLWREGFQPDVLPKSWRDMDWLWMDIHRYEDR